MTIKQLSHVSVWVHDQDQALAFYTEKLGLELRDDVSLPELGGFRWLTVGPVGPPVFDADTLGKLQELMAKGAAGTLFFSTDDCQASYEELKGRGVEFSEEPSTRPYGIDAALRDPSGNSIRLVQST